MPIRCVRVETNINLSKVRYIQIQYRFTGIEPLRRAPTTMVHRTELRYEEDCHREMD